MEQLFAGYCVRAYCRLALGRGQPSGKLSRRLFGIGMLHRIEQDHIVAVQQRRIALITTTSERLLLKLSHVPRSDRV